MVKMSGFLVMFLYLTAVANASNIVTKCVEAFSAQLPRRQQLITSNESWTFDQASAALQILTEGRCLSPSCVLVFLGRSNGPLQAVANAKDLDVINLPITNFRYNPIGFETYPNPYEVMLEAHRFLNPLGNAEIEILTKHFNKFFQEKLAAGAREFRII